MLSRQDVDMDPLAKMLVTTSAPSSTCIGRVKIATILGFLIKRVSTNTNSLKLGYKT